MRILIYGAGAVGQALGCLLRNRGHQVDLVLRERFIPEIGRKGLTVTGIFGTITTKPGSLGLFSNMTQLNADYDYALVTVKSYDTPLAIKDLLPYEDHIASIVSMQNGCGNVEQFVKAFAAEKVLGARIITGFEITTPGTVNITVTADAIHIGRIIDGGCGTTSLSSAETLARIISDAGHPAITVSNIHQSLYAKLLYNCALNPLGAILGVHYGLLGERKETRRLIDAVINETFAVIHTLGGTTEWKDPEAYRKFFYNTLLPATYHHRSSMLQDLENGKKTEVDSLVGFVSRKGIELGLSTPTCNMLVDLLSFRQYLATKDSGATI